MNYFENSKYSAAFDRCVDVMSRLLQKYGPLVLDRYEETAQGESVCKVEASIRKKVA